MPAIGIDLGGTKISAAAVLDCKVVSELRSVPTPEGPESIINATLNLIDQFQRESVITGVGIATAGIVDCSTGEVIGSTGNLPGWAGTPLKKIIESKTMLPVYVENDANAAAYGDALAMGLRHASCIVGVTLGTGIGTGIVMNGMVYHGASWGAGEGGHIRISLDNRRLCTCGLFDCWEAYGSGRGLVATCRDLLHNVTPAQTHLAEDPAHITTRMITASADRHDMIARKSIQIWHEHVATGLANLAHILSPDYFIISGGMSKVINIELLAELVSDRTLSKIGEKVKVILSTLGDYAGIIGAAQLVLDGVVPGLQVNSVS